MADDEEGEMHYAGGRAADQNEDIRKLRELLTEAHAQIHARDLRATEHQAEMLSILLDVERITAQFSKPGAAPKASDLWRNTEERVISLDQALHDLIVEFPDVSNPCTQRSKWPVFAKKIQQARAVLGDHE